jgi:hypothetical protein
MSSSSSVRHLAIRAYASSDGVLRLLQFITTCLILRRRISGRNTRIVQRMALTTIFAIRRWARPTSRMRAVYSRHMPSQPTCFPTLVLSSIHSSSVKRFAPPVISDLHPQLTDMVSVRQAPGRAFQLHVFIRGACHPYVNFISFFSSLSTRADPPLEKRFPNISQGREH